MDEDQDITPPAMTILEEKKSGDKETSVGKLVKLCAYNLFASRVRDSIKDENPVANGHEVKRIVGQKWAELGSVDKQEFINIAQNENDMLEKMPVDPNTPKRKRRRKPKSEAILSNASAKKGIQLPDGDGENREARHDQDSTRLKIVRKKELSGSSSGTGAAKGAGDHSENTGYLMTVRVGDTDIIFWGVVFDPFHSQAPAKINDLGSAVKFPRKNDSIIYPPTGPLSSKQVHKFMSRALR